MRPTRRRLRVAFCTLGIAASTITVTALPAHAATAPPHVVIAGTADRSDAPPLLAATLSHADDPGSAARMLAVSAGLFVVGGLSLTVRRRMNAARATVVESQD